MAKKNRYSTGDEVLDRLLLEDKSLTAKWYERMSGQIPWNPGEREKIETASEELAKKINARMKIANRQLASSVRTTDLQSL